MYSQCISISSSPALGELVPQSTANWSWILEAVLCRDSQCWNNLMQCLLLMLKVISQCAGLLHTNVVYEKHSGALLARSELLKIHEVTEMVKQKYVVLFSDGLLPKGNRTDISKPERQLMLVKVESWGRSGGDEKKGRNPRPDDRKISGIPWIINKCLWV